MEPTIKEAILDLILRSAQDLVQEVTVGEPFCNSEHNIITFNMLAGGSKPKKSTTLTYNYRKRTYTKMRKLEVKRSKDIKCLPEA